MDINKPLKLKIIEYYDNQAKFAWFAQEDETYVSRVIRGYRTPGQEKAKKWARLLGCKIKDIFPN